MLDVHTIGAGGGSIARVSADHALRVGPESAGAEPGPACYGRGGIEATVTDANLVLGRTPATLGGEVTLETELARRAIMERVARPLGLTLEDAAEGIVELLNNNMAAAIRSVSIERGHDPHGFALVAGGGGGALHAGRLAELLGIPVVVVPASAGLLSTLGLLATDLKSDFVQTSLQRSGSIDLARLDAALGELERKASDWLRAEGVDEAGSSLLRTAGLRYTNQAYEITVSLPPRAAGAPLAAPDFAAIEERFHQAHEKLYAWSSRTLPVELVNLCVTASGRLQKLAVPVHQPLAGARGTPASQRSVWFGRAAGRIETPVYDFACLVPEQTIAGPAVIEQRFSTVLVLPGHRARMDRYGNIIMEVRP